MSTPAVELSEALTASLATRAKRDPMTTREADTLLGVENGTVAAAARRGEISTVRKPGGKVKRVTCKAVADWVAEYWTEP